MNEFEDYADLYAPVASFALIQLILALDVRFSYDVDQIDVKGAFLHASLPDSVETYIRIPNNDYMPTANGQFVNLRKCVYGLRQNPTILFKHLADTLCAIGFRRSKYWDCIFIRGSPSAPIHIIGFFDD